MAERVTKAQIQSQFARLCAALGKRQARAYNDVGGWRIDYQPGYGGIVIEEILNSGGGVGHPIIPMRMSPREFVDTIHFTLRAMEAARR